MATRPNSNNFIISLISILIIIGISTLPITNTVASQNNELELGLQLTIIDKKVDNEITERILNKYLEDKLELLNDTDELEVIIQFKDSIETSDLEILDKLGIELKHQYYVLPAVYAKGTKSAILSLKHNSRIFWVEYNEPIDWCMEQSLSTINATRAWNAMVIDEFGNTLAPIDGTGVTVVVLDTGIDAGHPDLDYQEKTIVNLKSDFGVGPWVDMENSDTSYGHGTHCAGTVAGNGEASAGARRGVAPNANMIGLSIGDVIVNLANAVGGYEWIYNNAHRYPNVRVISNSWGTSGGEYDPNDAVSKLIEQCAFDKNIVSVFAAGNAGRGQHEGDVITTNPYANVPVSIGIAAFERDGSGMADFTSRGHRDKIATWPDIGAPGVNICSTAARRTYIDIMVRAMDPGNADPYYFPISGTSMATPHVSGAVALLFQACPSLKVTDHHDDTNGNDTAWFDNNKTVVHEAELILEASASYLERQGDNGVPGNFSIGWTGSKHDFAQGYGLINVEKAVAIALTLNELRTRDFNGDGTADYPDATVYDAINEYEKIMVTQPGAANTDTLITQWNGEWTRFTNQTSSTSISTDQSHFIYIPEVAEKLILDLEYERISTSQGLKGAVIRVVIDYTDDGVPDWPDSITYYEDHSELDLTSGGFNQNRGKTWNFNIEGVGFNIPGLTLGNPIGQNFYEVTVEYSANVKLILNVVEEDAILEFEKYSSKFGQLRFGPPTDDYNNGKIEMQLIYFDLTKLEPLEPPEVPPEPFISADWLWWLLMLAVLALILIAIVNYYKKHKKLPFKLNFKRTG